MTDTYRYTNSLNKEQWAWEFLRRNPEYQRDYSVFIHRWRALEKDYGTAPNCDSQRWKNDPRSLANEWESEMTLLEGTPNLDGDNTTQEPIQIDSWMGKKWGFSQFPLSPEVYAPKVPEELLWREQTIDLDEIRFDAQDDAPITQINVDLRYSLKDQLDQAHKDLITLSHQLQRTGNVRLLAQDHYEEWLLLLKILDNAELFEKSPPKQQENAQQMSQSGYRKIMLMRGQ